ncbi:MAG: aldo/keto reductase [Mariniphaga sp.]
MHALTDPDWNKNCRGAMDYLERVREEGIIKVHGVSCHSPGALQTAASEPWVQVDLARMNPAGVRMDAEVPVVVKVLQDMKSKGKGIIGMKILGAGHFRNKVDEALQYALSRYFTGKRSSHINTGYFSQAFTTNAPVAVRSARAKMRYPCA